jgi:hypothetical protein
MIFLLQELGVLKFEVSDKFQVATPLSLVDMAAVVLILTSDYSTKTDLQGR